MGDFMVIFRLLQKLCGYGTYIDVILKQQKINEFIERDEEAGSKCTFLNDPFPPVFTLLAVLANASVSLIQQIATRKKQSNRTVLLIIFSKGKNTAEDLRGQNLSMSVLTNIQTPFIRYPLLVLKKPSVKTPLFKSSLKARLIFCIFFQLKNCLKKHLRF